MVWTGYFEVNIDSLNVGYNLALKSVVGKKLHTIILRPSQRENGVPYDQVMENELVESNGWVPEYQAFNSVYGILCIHTARK